MTKGSLVLYKAGPARVVGLGKKLQIELTGGETLSVRHKDVELLHPGPLAELCSLQLEAGLTEAAVGEMVAAWELLTGTTTSLEELAELVFGTFSPVTAWASWQWVADGLYFQGTPGAVIARQPDEVAREKECRAERAAEEQAREAAIERFRSGHALAADGRFLRNVEELALGRSTKSRVLHDLGKSESPESAHAFLLELGQWDHLVNPHPHRLGLPLTPVAAGVPDLPDESRVDLTGLVALAIDDEGNQEPDDAISFHENRFWVHVADVAALVSPDSPADLEARGRGASLYLPEGTVQMLPERAIATCGLGLDDVSPALSFGMDIDNEGAVRDVEIVRSWVRVTRLTYEEAEDQLEEEPIRSMLRVASLFETRRGTEGAVRIDLPEVRIWVDRQDDFRQFRVNIRPLKRLNSRILVTEAMLMAGVAVGRLALEQGIPIPYTNQAPPRMEERPQDVAGMFALRRSSSPSEYSLFPGLHAGLGLAMYVQVTSPLRRYLDLVVHQQLRAHLQGGDLLSQTDLLERVGAAMVATDSVRQTERLSRQHWTMVHLHNHPDWEGDGIVVETRGPQGRRGRSGARGVVLIPELDLTVPVYLRHELPLNSSIRLGKPVANVPALTAHLQVL